VGQGFAAREPLLGKGELFPPVAIDVPAHPGATLYAVCCPLQDKEDLLVADLVMLLELLEFPAV